MRGMALLLLGGEDLVDSALHVEVALGHLVELAVQDHLESADRLLDRDVLARRAGEDLGDGEGLGKEALDLPGAIDRELVLWRKLVEAEDGDYVLQVLVALEHPLELAGHAVVVLADDRDL